MWHNSTMVCWWPILRVGYDIELRLGYADIVCFIFDIEACRYRINLLYRMFCFDFWLLRYQRIFDIGIKIISRYRSFMLRYRSFMLWYRMFFDIEWFWRALLMQGSGPQLQAAVRLRWYWVMIAVKMSLLPGGRGTARAQAGPGAPPRRAALRWRRVRATKFAHHSSWLSLQSPKEALPFLQPTGWLHFDWFYETTWYILSTYWYVLDKD